MTMGGNPRFKRIRVICLLIIGLCFIILLFDKLDAQSITKMMSDFTSYERAIAPSMNSETPSVFKNVTKMSRDLKNKTTQKERLRLISKTCSNHARFSNTSHNDKVSRLYFSEKYNFSYCKVPKIGSTFWTQVFQILQHDTNKSDKIFQSLRSDVHLRGYHTSSDFSVKKLHPVIVVTRNPFSRLYSAFIDKSYLMLFPSLNHQVRRVVACPITNKTKHLHGCNNNIAFSEFLEFIVKSVKIGAALNEHWAPVYLLCKPCDLNVSFVAKQESFSADVELALKKFKVHKDKFDVLMSALHDHRIEQSLPGIIATAYINTKNIRSCLDAKTLVHRLWESFQIQGYILNHIKLPSEKFPNLKKFEDVKYVTQVIMDTIKKFPITSKESQFQRQSALAHAYKGVDQDIIKAIQKIYEIDFEMFDYSVQPPI